MKVIIAGSRSFNDFSLVEWYMEEVTARLPQAVEAVISGKAVGADSLGERWAEENGVEVLPFPVTPVAWRLFGLGAARMRNAQMATAGDVLVAFWDGRSSGTQHMIECALQVGLPRYVVSCKGEVIHDGN